MAGQGARFGYRFKPFLDVWGQTFIEAAFLPFRPWLAQIANVHFVFTREQDAAHDVRTRLLELFPDVPHEATILDAPTQGPAQTLDRCLEIKAVSGPVMVCDCDHAVNVDALMRIAEERPEIECAVPTWDLEGEALHAWSVASILRDGRIAAVAEKALPESGESFRGMIGCYYFADAARLRHLIARTGAMYLSDVIAGCLQAERPVLSVAVREARFFGDPARLARVASGHG
jgi:GTP:adenosylcobinamide-phosphate guanylyltransferase